MRIFASDKVSTLMKKLGMEKGEAIEHNWVTKAIGNAQKKVEGHNFDIRKHLLDYDDVANEQRKYIYNKRDEFLNIDNRPDILEVILHDVFTDLIDNNINIDEKEEEINNILQRDFHININAREIISSSTKKEEAIEKILDEIKEEYSKNISSLPNDIYLELIKDIFINIIDKSWIDHIQAMEHLRQGIGLRSYAQKNPKQEYKREAFEMFAEMQNSVHYSFISLLFRLDYNSANISKDKPENKNIITSEEKRNINDKKSPKNTKRKSKKRNKRSKKNKRK